VAFKDQITWKFDAISFCVMPSSAMVLALKAEEPTRELLS
jgi:hypothetical protein